MSNISYEFEPHENPKQFTTEKLETSFVSAFAFGKLSVTYATDEQAAFAVKQLRDQNAPPIWPFFASDMHMSTLNLTKSLSWVGLTLMSIAFSLFVCSAADASTSKRQIEDRPLKVIDTGLEIMSCCSTSPASLARFAFWLNNDLIAVNALQDLPDANGKELQRIMLVDPKTGKFQKLLDSAELFCWNDEREVASVASVGGGKRITRLINLSTSGVYSEFKGKSDLNHYICRSESLMRPKGSISASLRESDGYILLSEPGKNFDPAKTGIWYRPGKPPIDTKIRASELRNRLPEYLKFSNKYLLNKWDSQNNAWTDKRLAGLAWGDRPYSLTPYRLLSPQDGKIEEIPYPYIIFEYGVLYFGELLPTKAGILINNTGRGKGEHGLFLLNGEQLTRIWGGPGWFDAGHNEVADGIELSPDGCAIIFSHYVDWHLETKKPISLMNLCQGGTK